MCLHPIRGGLRIHIRFVNYQGSLLATSGSDSLPQGKIQLDLVNDFFYIFNPPTGNSVFSLKTSRYLGGALHTPNSPPTVLKSEHLWLLFDTDPAVFPLFSGTFIVRDNLGCVRISLLGIPKLVFPAKRVHFIHLLFGLSRSFSPSNSQRRTIFPQC